MNPPKRKYYGVYGVQCRSLIKKPWAFIRAPHVNPTILGVIGPGFLNQVPTLAPKTGIIVMITRIMISIMA